MIKPDKHITQGFSQGKTTNGSPSGILLTQRIAWRKTQVAWLCLVLGVTLLFFREGLLEVLPTVAIIWGVPLLFGGLAIILFRTARQSGENPYLVPCSALTLFFALAYGLGILNVYYYDMYPWEAIPDNAFTFLPVKPVLPEVALLIFIGGLGLVFGTLLSPRPLRILLPSMTLEENESSLRTKLFLLLPIFAAATALSIQQSAPLLVRHIFTLIGDFGFLILIIAGAEIAVKPGSGFRRWCFYVLAMIALALVIGTPTGMRGHTLRPFILLGIGVVITHRRIPRWLWCALPILIIIVMPALNYIKVNARQISDQSGLLTSAAAHVESMGFRERLEDGLQVFGNRVFGLPYHLGMYVQTWPEAYAFEHGQTFLIELSDVLPRVLDPWKGETSGALNWYAVKAGIALEPDPATGDWTSAVFDGISEYYINFGPWGILLLSIIHGYYFAILYDWLVLRSRAFFFTALFAYLIWFTWPDAGVLRRIISDSRLLVVWILMFVTINRRSGEGQSTRHRQCPVRLNAEQARGES